MRGTKLSAKWMSYAPYFLSILRIVAAVLFMLHGTMKLFAFPPGVGSGNTVNIFSEIGLAAILETFGGALLIFGLFTRPVAFVLSGQMAVAFFQAHAHKGFWLSMTSGETALLYCFLWLFFSAVGAGAWSVDAKIRTRNKVT
jgi:putative oxidoreductase